MWKGDCELTMKTIDVIKHFSLHLMMLSLIACAKTSSDPEIEELFKTRAPTFDGQASKIYIVPGINSTVSGECDPISKGIEYSFNASTWVVLPGGCVAGAFSVTNVQATPRGHVYVRAKTKTGYTSSGHAQVNLAIPPSSPEMSTVISSRTDDDGATGGTNTLGYVFTNDSSASAAHDAHFGVIGTTYGQ